MIGASSSSGSAGDKWPKKVAKNLRNPFTATTEGEQNLPAEVAPLIFLREEDDEAQFNNKSKPWAKVNDYLDKRARARYASDSHPRSPPAPAVI